MRRKRGRTTIRVPGVRVADDLVERRFRPTAPNVLWIADVTYLRTWEGWLYLAAVQDAYSRRIVGWSMADHMRAELVVDALQMAVARRRPAPGLIHHSDQGSQYVSLAFGQAARDAGIARSMGSKGDCYDNAVAESFFATLKKELVHRRSWPTRRELTTEVFEYIEAFYNRVRRHSTLGMLSPADYENRTLEQPRCEPRRFAARTLTHHDQHLRTPKAQPCPAKRGNSISHCRIAQRVRNSAKHDGGHCAASDETLIHVERCLNDRSDREDPDASDGGHVRVPANARPTVAEHAERQHLRALHHYPAHPRRRMSPPPCTARGRQC